MVTSPAASVWRVTVLPSDLTTVPVRRSPFLSVTWSAKSADESPKNAIRVNNSNLRNTTLPSTFRVLIELYEGPGTAFEHEFRAQIGKRRQRGEVCFPPCFSTRSWLALCFGFFLVGWLRRGIVLHAIFQGTNPLTQTLAELRQFLGAEDQQGNKEDHQQVHRLK